LVESASGVAGHYNMFWRSYRNKTREPNYSQMPSDRCPDLIDSVFNIPSMGCYIGIFRWLFAFLSVVYNFTTLNY